MRGPLIDEQSVKASSSPFGPGANSGVSAARIAASHARRSCIPVPWIVLGAIVGLLAAPIWSVLIGFLLALDSVQEVRPLFPLDRIRPEILELGSATLGALIGLGIDLKRNWLGGGGKCRRLQWSLRALFVAVLLCALCCSWCAVKLRKAKIRQEALQAIKDSGGSVFSLPVRLGLAPSGGPQAMLERGVFGTSDYVSITTDAALEQLRQLRPVHALTLTGGQVTDSGMQHLAGLSHLEHLSIIDCNQVTDRGLENIRTLTHLRRLDLERTPVTDAGLKYVAKLPELWYLNLSRTAVTDDGIHYLKELTQLRYLNLRGTKVTREGMESLQRALPHCEITGWPPWRGDR